MQEEIAAFRRPRWTDRREFNDDGEMHLAAFYRIDMLQSLVNHQKYAR